MFAPFPASAAWRHRDAREGFEVVFFETAPSIRLRGQTAAVELGLPWSVGYDITLDEDWRTRRAHVEALSVDGERSVTLDLDGSGRWRVDGTVRPDLDGCLDVDLESSACTNAFPVHRMRLGVGDEMGAPAAYVRAADLTVERLEQRYVRLADDHRNQRFHYEAPVFDVECVLVYDESGLVTDYPGIATRTH